MKWLQSLFEFDWAFFAWLMEENPGASCTATVGEVLYITAAGETRKYKVLKRVKFTWPSKHGWFELHPEVFEPVVTIILPPEPEKFYTREDQK